MMDAKALAKSKRAHSLHHKKKHQPHQASRAPPTGPDDKKPPGKPPKESPLQADERPPKSLGRRPLLSNWDRYDEDFDLGSEEAESSSSQPTEFVAPKSKGADYAYLISEAKAQSQAHCRSDVVSLFDDFINDFTQDFGPVLAARGQSMLSWMADDSFEFEDTTSTSPEAPFLSLNLNALAEQLSKAKLSERLYLEPDLIPIELIDDELHACGEDKHCPQTHETRSTDDTSLRYNQQVQTSVLQTSSSPITAHSDIPVETYEKNLKPANQNVDEILKSQAAHRSIFQKSEGSIDSVSGKPPTFEAASAEEELDMLLSSLSESKVLETSGESSLGNPSTSAAVITSTIHDDIDKLLEETASLAIMNDRPTSDGLKVNLDTMSSDVDPSSKSKLLDDFDSWLDTI